MPPCLKFMESLLLRSLLKHHHIVCKLSILKDEYIFIKKKKYEMSSKINIQSRWRQRKEIKIKIILTGTNHFNCVIKSFEANQLTIIKNGDMETVKYFIADLYKQRSIYMNIL